MSANRFHVWAVMAVMCAVLTGVMSGASDEATGTADQSNKTATVVQESKSTVDSVIPDIAGIWSMKSPYNVGRCEIRRVTGVDAEYECKLLEPANKTTYLVNWVPDAREFRGTITEIPEIKGTMTIALKPDERITTLQLNITMDDEAKKSLDVLKSSLTLPGVTRSEIDKLFEDEFQTRWTRKSKRDPDAIPLKKPGRTNDPTGTDSANHPSGKSSVPKDESGASDPNNILLCFLATWSSPCQQMKPIVTTFERMGFPIRKVDIDLETNLARQHKIEEVPCFVLVEDGRETARLKGRVGEDQLRGLMAKLKKQDTREVGDDAASNPAAADNIRGKAVGAHTASSSSQGPSGAHGPARANPAPSNRIEGGDVLLVETKEGLAGYSKSLGVWDRAVVGLPKDGKSRLKNATVSGNFISVLIDDQLFGFSGRSGRWAKLKIPEQFVGKALPNHGLNILSVQMGDETYVLSPTRAEWTSSNEKEPPATDVKSDFNTRSAEQKLRRNLDRPESRRLTTDIAEHEARAQALASQIRERSKTRPEGEGETQETITLRKELDSTLQQAFDLKSELEQLRIQELQSRLGELEQLVGRRQARRSQIVLRRARELIDGEETNWNDEPSVDAIRPISNASRDFLRERATAVPVAKEIDSALPRNSTQIKFSSNGNLSGSGPPVVEHDGVINHLPFRFVFSRDEKAIRRYQLMFVLPSPVARSRSMQLEIYPARGDTQDYLSKNAVPFSFSFEDVSPSGSKTVITKVVYLSSNPTAELLPSRLGTIVSTSLEPGVDPIAEAEKKGSIVAVLRMAPVGEGRNDSTKQNPNEATRSGQQAGSPDDAGPSGKLASQINSLEATKQRMLNPAGVSSDQGPLPSYKDLATSLVQGAADVETANASFADADNLRKNKVISNQEFEIARRAKETAARKYQILIDDYRGTMHDLELQLDEVHAASEFASKRLQRLKSLAPGTISGQALADAENDSVKAKAPIERLRARYKLYKKAGELLIGELKSEPPPLFPDSFEIAAWGLRLAKAPVNDPGQSGDTKYRAGLRVVNVADKSPAANSGISNDDILVGLDKWETVTADSVLWILHKMHEQSDDNKLVKYYVIRGTQTLHGTLPVIPNSPPNVIQE